MNQWLNEKFTNVYTLPETILKLTASLPIKFSWLERCSFPFGALPSVQIPKLFCFCTLPETNIAPENQWLKNETSSWDGLVSVAMLVSGSVYNFSTPNQKIQNRPPPPKKKSHPRPDLLYPFNPEGLFGFFSLGRLDENIGEKTSSRRLLENMHCPKNHGISSSWWFGDPRPLRKTHPNPSRHTQLLMDGKLPSVKLTASGNPWKWMGLEDDGFFFGVAPLQGGPLPVVNGLLSG